MIAIDTSALMAVVHEEPGCEVVAAALEGAGALAISAGTLVEALVVSRRRGSGHVMSTLIDRLAPEVVPVTRDLALKAVDAYDLWGRGLHPAGLNLGDCFAYALAKERGCPLLYVGDDFAQTDIASATTA